MADLKISVDMRDIPVAVQATQRFERQINTLASQLARGSITTGTYQKGLQQLSRQYARLGVDVNTAKSAVMSYGRAAAEAAREQQALFAASQASSAGINRMGVGMQQAGYQVGDFLVQIQSGTNAFVAFGQQATQLVGILPMFNSVMGISGTRLIALSAGLGIAIPLITALAAAFMRTRQSSSSATGGFTTMEAAMKSAREESSRMADEIERLNLGLRNNTELNIRRAIEEQKLRVATAQELVNASQLDPDGLIIADERLRREQETLRQYEEQFQTLQDQAKEIESINRTREEEVKNAQALLDLQQRQREFMSSRTLDLENQIRMMETTLTYGEDSIEVERLRAHQARQAFLFEAMRNNLSLEQLTTLMAIYDEYARLNEILSKPLQGPNLPTSTTTTTRPSRGAAQRDPVQQLRERLQLEEDLLNKTQAQRRVIQALGSSWRDYDESAVAALIATAEQLENTNRKIAEQQSIADTIKDSMSDAFMSMVDGTKTVEDAFKGMARAIIKQLYEVLVVQQLVGSFNVGTGAGSGIVGSIGRALFRESGGSMMAGRPYIVGERGPELVIPGRSSTVANADLTNKAMGGSNGVTVVNNINVTGGTDPAAIRQEVAKLMPQITNATKTAVIDARRRGGQMKAAFGS